MSSQQIEPSMKELSDLVMESLKGESGHYDWEFGEYGYTLRAHFCKDPAVFQERFLKGYEVLMEELNLKRDN